MRDLQMSSVYINSILVRILNENKSRIYAVSGVFSQQLSNSINSESIFKTHIMLFILFLLHLKRNNELSGSEILCL